MRILVVSHNPATLDAIGKAIDMMAEQHGTTVEIVRAKTLYKAHEEATNDSEEITAIVIYAATATYVLNPSGTLTVLGLIEEWCAGPLRDAIIGVTSVTEVREKMLEQGCSAVFTPDPLGRIVDAIFAKAL